MFIQLGLTIVEEMHLYILIKNFKENVFVVDVFVAKCQTQKALGIFLL